MTQTGYPIETDREKWARKPAGSQSMWSRYAWMIRPDWQDFSDAVAAHYPGASYLLHPKYAKDMVPGEPPKAWLYDDLLTAYDNRYAWAAEGEFLPSTIDIVLIFEPGWQPDFGLYRPYSTMPDILRWSIRNIPYLSAHFQSLYLPTPEMFRAEGRAGASEIVFYTRKGDAEHVARRRQFFRLFGKFASARNQAVYRLAENTLMRIEAKGSSFWMGHHAQAEILADPALYFIYGSNGIGYRPAEIVTRTPEQPPRQT